MTASAAPAPAFVSIFGWRRVRFALAFSGAIGLLLGFGWKSGFASIVIRTWTLGLVGLLVFGLFERWPKRLPRFAARWALQVAAVGLVMPFTTFTIYKLSTPEGAPPFWHDKDRMEGFSALTGLGIFLAPWVALAALVRQKEALARHQALELDLTRSELERQALGARLQLLQAQVTPHFLFNTLANIQALVDAGSPQASAVLRSLIAYLRAAVPLLHEPVATLAQEVELAKAYLELMHMRIPDRLQFDVYADPSALSVRCPPTTLLTLVENAVRHGIDPTEEGGRIDVRVQRVADRVSIRVADTGAGLHHSDRSLGTGLSTLRERLQLLFGDEAQLHVTARESGGVVAEVIVPARGAS